MHVPGGYRVEDMVDDFDKHDDVLEDDELVDVSARAPASASAEVRDTRAVYLVGGQPITRDVQAAARR